MRDLFQNSMRSILRFVTGLLFAVGLFARPIAFLLAGKMAVAYWPVQFALEISQPDGWMPVVNKGELAILYCLIFLYFMTNGAGSWSLDAVRQQRSIHPAS